MKLIEVVYIFALVTCFVGDCTCVSNGVSVTNIANYAYQAAVLCPVIMCSGAIVSSKCVVTTATCINSLSPAQVQVLVGSTQYYSGGITSDVAVITKHPNFNPSNYDYNIAVIGLTTPLTGGTFTIIPLATALPPYSTILFTTAYGAVDINLTLPDYLQRASLQSYPMNLCQSLKSNRLTSSMFCAGDVTGKKDLCAADQGAPLVYQNTLYGIYSWGCSCGLAVPNYSSPVFTSIPYVRLWIQSTIAAIP